MIVLRLYVLFHLTSIFCALYRLSNLRNRRLYLLWSFWQNYVALLEADFYPLAKFRLNSRNTACPTCDFRKSLFHLISWFLSSRLFIEVIAFIILCTKMGFWPLILLKREATLRSQIEGYTRLLIFRKISSLPVFSPTQVKNFPPSPLLFEPPRLLNLKKDSSLPFY